MGLAALSAFEFVNDTLGEVYRLQVMSEAGGTVRSSLKVGIETAPLSDFPDTLIVVGELVPKPPSQKLRDYIARAGTESRRVAGICTGAFLLADAGLLDGRLATTHWAHAKRLQEKYPQLHVDDDRIFVQDGNIWTSAGMSAGIDLTLALIEDDFDAALARLIARKLVVYHRRPGGQSQFSALLDLEPRSDRIRKALVYAKEHLRPRSTSKNLPALRTSARGSSVEFSSRKRATRPQRPWKGSDSRLPERCWRMDTIQLRPSRAIRGSPTETECGERSCARSASLPKASGGLLIHRRTSNLSPLSASVTELLASASDVRKCRFNDI